MQKKTVHFNVEIDQASTEEVDNEDLRKPLLDDNKLSASSYSATTSCKRGILTNSHDHSSVND